MDITKQNSETTSPEKVNNNTKTADSILPSTSQTGNNPPSQPAAVTNESDMIDTTSPSRSHSESHYSTAADKAQSNTTHSTPP